MKLLISNPISSNHEIIMKDNLREKFNQNSVKTLFRPDADIAFGESLLQWIIMDLI